MLSMIENYSFLVCYKLKERLPTQCYSSHEEWCACVGEVIGDLMVNTGSYKEGHYHLQHMPHVETIANCTKPHYASTCTLVVMKDLSFYEED